MPKSLFLLVYLFLLINSSFGQRSKEILYAGTNSVRGSKGIYVFELDRARSRISLIQTIQTQESPNFLAVHPSGNFLYVVNRGSLDEMVNSGSVSAFKIDRKTGKLTPLNERPSYGNGPCHISIDKTGKCAIISNYGEGNFVVLPIFDDGLLGSSSDSRKHLGKSVDPNRQDKSHVHSAILSPDNKFVLVSDLGLDKIFIYKLDASSGRITNGESPYIDMRSGSGPRHLAFHPSGRFAYSVQELSSTICAMSYKKDNGSLTIIQDSVSMLPKFFKGENTAADIHVDPRGKFLYASNRGHNSLAIFKISEKGSLQLLGHQSTKGQTPRNFMIDPQGQFLLVGNQNSDTLAWFKIEAKTGLLKYVNLFKIPSPVCLELLTIR